MTTLLMRLTGPMQAWGTQSRFSTRDTGLEPSKSGVIGLICAALGRSRTAPLDDLAALRMGVRADREGVMKVDYHTSGAGYGVPLAAGGKQTVLSNRYFLADADFLVGLEGDPDVLNAIARAISQPRWQIYLGRKAFVPSAPITLPDSEPWGPGLRNTDLEDALTNYPWLGDFDDRRRTLPVPEHLRIVLDATQEDATDVRGDVPISFAERRFITRFVRTGHVPVQRIAKEE